MNTTDHVDLQQYESVQSHMTKMLKLIGFTVLGYEIKDSEPSGECKHIVSAITCPDSVEPERILFFVDFLRNNGFAARYQSWAMIDWKRQGHFIIREDQDLLMKLTEEDVNQFLEEEFVRVLSN